jgi:predicted metal-dependent TIM-barrel fold hydrolase
MLTVKENIAFIDSHTHLDIVTARHPECIAWLQQVKCLPVSWSYAGNSPSVQELKKYLHYQAEIIRQLNSRGLPCFFLTGIHPRSLPPDLTPEEVRDLLNPHLDNPLCLGIGEIGIETGSTHEQEILCAQLALAPEVVQRGKVLGLHTPKEKKLQITRSLLSLLESYQDCSSSMVIDHCTQETVGMVLERGFWAGVTMNPAKTSALELDEMLPASAAGADKIILNTDSGNKFFENLYDYYVHFKHPVMLKENLARTNALQFFRLRAA